MNEAMKAAIVLFDQSIWNRVPEVLEAIKKAGLSVSDANVVYMPDAGEYRFVLVTPEIERNGPRIIYARIQKALQRVHVKFPLSKIFLSTRRVKSNLP